MKLKVYWLGWTGYEGIPLPCDKRGYTMHDDLSYLWAIEFSEEDLLSLISPWFSDGLEKYPSYSIYSFEIEL